MKKLYLLLTFAAFSISALAQCVIEPFSLQKKLSLSDFVVEGTVVDRYSFWDAGHKNIYTANLIRVYKIFEGGQNHQWIELITEGGTVGLTMHRSDPSLQVSVGQTGVFMLRLNRVALPDAISGNSYPEFQPVASVQSFLRYDRGENMVYGYFEKYDGIESLLYPKIESYTGKKYRVIDNEEHKGPVIRPLSAPVIDSFSRDTITAGTGSKLTIYGSNFGFARGSSGRVMFTDPDYGDGRFYDELLDPNYISWSNSKIEVIVPTKSGTGKVKVVNASAESGVSATSITVLYAHQNVMYGNSGVGIDTAYHHVDLINLNGSGGYTWQFNTTFRSNFAAVNAFLRSMETWRCNTLMNWNTGKDTSLDETADDNINLVRWTTFSDSRLGVCWTRFGGCFSSGPVVHWHAEELDIEFDKDRNWYYGDVSPQTSQYDFQSVSSHELGHGHQMGHVIDPNKMMHYSLTIGERKADLHDDDVACGVYIRESSKVKNPCGPNPLIHINVNDCNITRPKALAAANKIKVCPGDTVLFTSLSEGVVNDYNWDFGTGANPATSNSEGPHKVTFSQAGTVSIQLIVGNDFGEDTVELTVTVDPPVPDIPAMFMYDTLVCSGSKLYAINKVLRATDYEWSLPGGGGVFFGSNDDTAVVVTWQDSGLFTLEVTASNNCGESAPQSAEISVLRTVEAGFSFTADGRFLSFNNESTGDIGQWVWRFGDGDTSLESNPVHEYDMAGDFTVVLETSNVCSNDEVTENIRVNWGAGISNNILSRMIDIYPNPADNYVTCKLKDEAHGVEVIEILDVTGKVVLREQVNGRNLLQLNVSGLADGTYVIRLSGQATTGGHGKLIIQNGK